MSGAQAGYMHFMDTPDRMPVVGNSKERCHEKGTQTTGRVSGGY
jgi:hypothetical protein